MGRRSGSSYGWCRIPCSVQVSLFLFCALTLSLPIPYFSWFPGSSFLLPLFTPFRFCLFWPCSALLVLVECAGWGELGTEALWVSTVTGIIWATSVQPSPLRQPYHYTQDRHNLNGCRIVQTLPVPSNPYQRAVHTTLVINLVQPSLQQVE